MAEKKEKFNIDSLLNTKSRGAAQAEEAAQETGSAFDVAMLDVDDLIPCNDNFYSTDNIDELAAAIELSGCIEQNLVVKPEVHGKYEIIAGHRRRLAVLKLIGEGKEEYRKVPCRIKKESDGIRDRLSLIFTNATARQLTDWEKVKQAEELKEVLTEYKKALQEENKDKPKEERERIGRIREIVAGMLNMSTTQVGRMEAISNNLSQDFKEELEKGNINISTAHELSRLDEEGQKKAYEKYEEKGGLHIKDVKPEEKEEITDEQAEKAQEAIKDAVKGEVNHAVFKVKNNVAEVEKVLRKYFGMSFQGGKLDGGIYIYRFQADGIAIIYTATWEKFLVNYPDLAKIVVLMIESSQLSYDNTTEDIQEEKTAEAVSEPEVAELKQKAAEPKPKEEETKPLPGHQDINNYYQEDVSEPQQEGLDFTTWIREKYKTAQYTMIQNEIRAVVALVPGIEDRITNALSVWVTRKTAEYQQYLQG